MITTILDKFDNALYEAWSTQAHQLLDLLESGLNKMDFAQKTPEAVNKILLLIEAARNATDRSEFADNVGFIQTELNTLVNHHQFALPSVNNFFFHARRSFNFIMKFFPLTLSAKYIEAIANPAHKSSLQAELNSLMDWGVKKGAKVSSEAVFGLFNDNVNQFMKMQLEAMPLGTLQVPPPVAIPKRAQTLSLLAQKIGTHQYNTLRSTLDIQDGKDAAKYIKEQTYGYTFEFYYMHVALLYDTLQKSALLSHGDSNLQAALLAQHGLSELNTKDALAFLNQTAEALGFTNAAALYQNYQEILNEKEFEVFKNIQQSFIAKANDSSVTIENDPVEKIMTLAGDEYARIQKKLKKKPNSAKNNSVYYTTLAYAGADMFGSVDVVSGIRLTQRISNIGGLAAEDFLSPQKYLGKEEDRPFYLKWFLQLTHYLINPFGFKEYLDSFLLGTLIEGGLFENRLIDNIEPIQHAYEQYIQEKIKENNKIVQQELDKIKDKTTEDLIPVLVQKMKAEKDHPDEIVYHALKKAYKHKLFTDIQSLSYAELENNISQQNQKIIDLNSTLKDANVYYAQIEDLRSPEKMPVLTFWDKFLRFFGYRTENVTNFEASEKEIIHLQSEIALLHSEPAALEVGLRVKLWHKAENQKALWDSYQNQSAAELINTIAKKLEKYQAAQHTLKNSYQSSAEDNTLIQNQTQRVQYYENILNIATTTLSSLLERDPENDFSPLSIEELSDYLQRLDNSKPGVTENPALFEKIDNLSNPIGDMLKERIAISQRNLLIEAQKQVAAYFKEQDILNLEDPYTSAINELKHIKIAMLSEENRIKLYDSIYHAITESFDTLQLDLPNLEKYYKNTRLNYYHYVNKGFQTADDTKIIELHSALSEKILKSIQLRREDPLSLDTLSSHLNALHAAKQSTASLSDWYNSWLWNPFSLVTGKNSLQTAQNFESASADLYQVYTEKMIQRLTQFLKDADTLFESQSKHQVVLHRSIESIQHNIVDLQKYITLYPEDNQLPLIKQCYEKVLDTAKRYDKTQDHREELLVAIEKHQIEKMIDIVNESDDVTFKEEVVHRIAALLQQENFSSKNFPITSGWLQMVQDNDAPHLNEVRNIYLFCEMAYQQLLPKNIKDIDPEKIKTYKQVLNNINTFKIRCVHTQEKEGKFQNKGRFMDHITQWDIELDTMRSAFFNKIQEAQKKTLTMKPK